MELSVSAVARGIGGRPALRWLPLGVTLAGLTGSVYAWTMLRAQQRASIGNVIASQSTAAAYEVALRLETNVSRLRGIAERWDDFDSRNRERWEKDARFMVATDPGIQAVEWIDPPGRVRWIIPFKGNEAAQDFDLTTEERRRTALTLARSSGQPTFSRTIDLVQGGKGALLFVPLHSGGAFRGFILGVFRVGALLDHVLARQVVPNCAVAVYEGAEEIYRRPGLDDLHAAELGRDSLVTISGVSWRLRVWPGITLLRTLESPVGDVLLGAGILVSLLLGFLVHDMIRRKRTEDALREGEARLRSILDGMLEGYSRCEVVFEEGRPCDFVYIDVNPAYERQTGLKNVVGKRITEVIPGVQESNPESFEAFARVAVTGKPEVLETYVPVLKMWLSISAFSPKKGEFAAVFENVTERRRAEDVLRKAEEKYRGLFENAIEGIFQATPDGHLITANSSFARMLGYESPGEVLSAIQDVESQLWVNPERRLEFLHRLDREGAVENFEVEIRRKDGSTIWVFGGARVVRGPTGAIEHWEGTLVDISERRQAEEAVLKQKATLETVLANMAQGMLIIDADLRVVAINGRFEPLFGFTKGEVRAGQSLEALIRLWATRTNTGAAQLDKVLEALRRREPFVSDYRQRVGEGPATWIQLFHNPLPTGGFVRTYTDITERKQAEEELARAQQQFLQAQKMEAVGRLAGGVAHDFNNLLTVIQGYGEMLSTSFGGDQARGEDVAEILKAAERAATLTRQLLAFSRRQMLEIRVLDLRETVAETEKMLRRVIGEDIELVVVKPGELTLVKADPGQIEQVLLNLAVNARDAMPAGGRLTIELAEEHLSASLQRADYWIPAGNYVVLTVGDTGSGMDAKTFSHVFEPFFTTKEKGKGTGLGLATVYGIVKQSGGFITVESEPGRGTTFRIYFPRAEGEAAAKPDAPAAGTGGAETILLVEDEPGVRELARRLLEARGYRVLAAASGADALALADRHGGPIHLLVTDLVMPGMGGREVAGKVMSRRPETRVLLMSGYSSGVFSREDLSESGAHFLQKPFTEAALARAVREVLDAPTPVSGGPKAGA